MMSAISGVFNILATPFAADESIDIASLRRLVSFQLDMGADGLTILGVLGEAAKLTITERQQVVDIVLAVVGGRAPVIVGTSHADAETCLQLTRDAIQRGAMGVMITPPRLTNPSEANILDFYGRVTEQINAPIVVQDYPLVHNITMSTDLLAAIAEKYPTCRYLKLEDPPLMQKISAILERTDKLTIFGGLGGMFFLEELERGAAGTMTGFSFTEVLVAVYRAHQAGKADEAAAIFDHYLPLIRFENQPIVNLPIRKAILQRRGAIRDARLREPFTPLDSGTQQEIDRVLRRAGIINPTIRQPIQQQVFG